MNLSSLGNGFDLKASISADNSTLNNYDSMALIKKGSVPALGGNYTLIDGTTEVVVGAASADVIVKDLALRNKALFFPHRTVNVSKAETENKVVATVYGANNKAAPTGKTVDVFTVTFAGFYNSRVAMNTLRNNSEAFDVWLFNNESVEMYTQQDFNIQITNVRDAVAGDNTYGRNGMFDIDAVGDKGQAIPLFGVNYSGLREAPKFTLTPGTLVNLTAGTCSGDYKKYSRTTTNTASSIPFTIDPTVACVTYSLYLYAGGRLIPSTGSTYATVNTATGTITFPAGHVLGVTKYVLIVQNEVGVTGEYKLEVTIA